MGSKRKKVFSIAIMLVMALATIAGVFCAPTNNSADAYNKLSNSINAYSSANGYNYIDYGEYPQTLIGEVKAEYLGNNPTPNSTIGLISRLIDMYRIRSFYSSFAYPTSDTQYDWFAGFLKNFYGNSGGTIYSDIVLDGKTYSIGFDWTTKYYTFYTDVGPYPARTKFALYNKAVDYAEKYILTNGNRLRTLSDDYTVASTSINSIPISNDGKIYIYLVEPVKWKVLQAPSNQTGYVTLMADNILDGRMWMDSTSDTYTDWHYSGLRDWIDNTKSQYSPTNFTVTTVARSSDINGNNGSLLGYYKNTSNSGNYYQRYDSNLKGIDDAYVVTRLEWDAVESGRFSLYVYHRGYGGDRTLRGNLDQVLSRDGSIDSSYYSLWGYEAHSESYSSWSSSYWINYSAGHHFIEFKHIKDYTASYSNEYSYFTFYYAPNNDASVTAPYNRSGGGSTWRNSYDGSPLHIDTAYRGNSFLQRLAPQDDKNSNGFIEINPSTYSYLTNDMMYERASYVVLPALTAQGGELSTTNSSNGLRDKPSGSSVYNYETKATDYAKMTGITTYNGDYGEYWLSSCQTSGGYSYVGSAGINQNVSGSAVKGIVPIIRLSLNSFATYAMDYSGGYYRMQGAGDLQMISSNGTTSSPVIVGDAPDSYKTDNNYSLVHTQSVSNIASNAKINATFEPTLSDDNYDVFRLDYSNVPNGGVILIKFFVNNDSSQGYVTPITTKIEGNSGTTYVKAPVKIGLFTSNRFYYLRDDTNQLYYINDSIIKTEELAVYVDPDATVDGSGWDIDHPCKFLQTALDKVGDGGTIITLKALTRENMLQISDNPVRYKGGYTSAYYDSSYTVNGVSKTSSVVNDRGIKVTIKRNGPGKIFDLNQLYVITIDNFIIDGQNYESDEPLVSCKYTSTSGRYWIYFNNTTIKNYNGIGSDSALHIDWCASNGVRYSDKAPLVQLSGCKFENNVCALGDGGAVYIGAAYYLYMSSCTFTGNTAGGSGGGLYLSNRYYGLCSNNRSYYGCWIRSNTFTDNRALGGDGGGLYISEYHSSV